MIDYSKVWKEYQKGLSFNTQQGLNEKVKTNENFFIGNQWEGVTSNGLPTPVYNFLKRAVLFIVSVCTSDNIKIQASALSASIDRIGTDRMAEVVNGEFERLMETNKIVNLLRVFMRNAAVDGDGCTHTYWNPKIETGQDAKGGAVTEIIENTRVFFGNANSNDVQKQPYIIIASREMVDEVKDKAKENNYDADLVTADTDDKQMNSENLTDDKVTVLTRYWRDKKTNTIWAIEATRATIVRKAWDTGLTLYPITWLNWDSVQDNYHGQAMITGLIPNQIFVNKLYAMAMLSMMTTAYPRIVYDKTRLNKISNQVGAALAVNGGDVNNVIKTIDGSSFSTEVPTFIQMAAADTLSNLGLTAASLGDAPSYNTSAILANQRAAATPHEITKQNLYQSVEDLGNIYINFMSVYYGKRQVYVSTPDELDQALEAAQIPTDTKIPKLFDFAELKNAHFSMKLDVGASSYWSEIASMQTLDNLIMKDKIDLIDYLERVPSGYIVKKQELIDKLKGRQASMPVNGGMGAAMPGDSGGTPPPNPTNSGMAQLAQKVQQTA